MEVIFDGALVLAEGITVSPLAQVTEGGIVDVVTDEVCRTIAQEKHHASWMLAAVVHDVVGVIGCFSHPHPRERKTSRLLPEAPCRKAGGFFFWHSILWSAREVGDICGGHSFTPYIAIYRHIYIFAGRWRYGCYDLQRRLP